MTKEEAIKRLEIIATNLCGQAAQNPNLWPDYKAVDMAISALRQQETVTNRNGLNEPLRCTGCFYLDEECVPCAHCMRAAGYADYYRQKPEEGTE